MIDFVEPCWDVNHFRDLDYVVSPHKDPVLVDSYVSSGHARTQMLIGNYYEPNPMPSGVGEIRSIFEQYLDSVAIGVNWFQPGWYLPMHDDPYTAYNRVFNPDKRPIKRVIVMLADSVPGQIIQIGANACGDWRAGQVFSWFGNELHAFYNMSREHRYAVQITGLVKQKA